MLTCPVFLKNGSNDFGFHGVGHHVAQAVVPNVSERFFSAGPLAALQFLLACAVSVFCHTNDVISGAASLDTHEESRILGEKLLGRRANALDDALLKKPAHASFVDWVPIEAVNVPAKDAVRLALFNAVEHPVEDRSARQLGRSAFLKDFVNGNVLPFCVRSERIDLVIQAVYLMVIVIRRFAGVEKIFVRSVHANSISILHERSSINGNRPSLFW